MTVPALQFSHDQAEAFDTIAEELRHAGVDLDDSLLTPPRDGKDSVLAVVGKAGSGKTMLLAELYKALEGAGVEDVSDDETPINKRVRALNRALITRTLNIETLETAEREFERWQSSRA